MMKKWLSVLLAAVLLTLLAVGAAAETSGDYEYELVDGKATITKYNGSATALTVPASLDGHAVDRVGETAFAGCYELTSVTLPEGLTGIDAEAFFTCDALETVSLPDSLTDLATDAFYGCVALRAIALPGRVARLAGNPFTGCSALTEITVAAGNAALEIRDGLLYNRAEDALVCWPQGLAVGSCAVPEGTRAIAPEAFFGCEAVTGVELPDSVAAIGNDAFRYCAAMEEIRIPADLATLGDSAFEGCSSLKSIELPRGLTRIPPWLLRDCDALVSMTVPEGVRSIAMDAFESCEALSRVILPASLTEVDMFAFYDCNALTDVYFTGTQAQWDAMSVEDFNDPLTEATFHLGILREADVDLPEDLRAIESQAFADLEGGLLVRFPEGVESIADDAFPPAGGEAPIEFIAPSGSYAESWCQAHGYTVWTE